MAQPEIPGTDIGRPVMPYGSDGSKWYALLVDALGRLQVDAEVGNFPADPATQTTLALCLTTLQKIDDLQGALGAEEIDQLRVESKDGDKLFGFESIVEQELYDPDLATGQNSMSGTAVDSDKIWVITTLSMVYIGTVPDAIYFEVSGLAGGICPLNQSSPVSGIWYCWSGDLYLRDSDFIKPYVDGATLHDTFRVRYCGYQMNVP